MFPETVISDVPVWLYLQTRKRNDLALQTALDRCLEFGQRLTEWLRADEYFEILEDLDACRAAYGISDLQLFCHCQDSGVDPMVFFSQSQIDKLAA